MQLSLSSCLSNSNRGFTPLRFSPALWLDASDSATLYDSTVGGSLVAADGTVARWEDKSGNGRHATQSTGVSQPLRKTAIQNGRDVVRFDGANDYMSVTAFGGNTTRSLFIVYKDTSSAQYVTPIGTQFTGAVGTYHGHIDNTQIFDATYTAAQTLTGENRFNGSDIGDGTATPRPSSLSLLSSIGSGAQESDMTTVGADNASPTSRCITGDIAEIILYTSALDANQRSQVELYLNRKWSIY